MQHVPQATRIKLSYPRSFQYAVAKVATSRCPLPTVAFLRVGAHALATLQTDCWGHLQHRGERATCLGLPHVRSHSLHVASHTRQRHTPDVRAHPLRRTTDPPPSRPHSRPHHVASPYPCLVPFLP